MSELIEQIDRDDFIAFLQSRATDYHCGKYIHHLNGVERIQLYQELETKRVEDKYYQLIDHYNCSGKDWNQAMFIAMMKSISDRDNKAEYMDLAYRVRYNNLMYERDKIENIEAMLIAASGLIGLLPIDPFTDEIRKRGAHLLNKYDIRKMSISQWRHTKKPLTSSLILRLLQIAQLLHSHEFLFNQVIACRKRDDILTLFSSPIRDEWRRYFGTSRSTLCISVDKRDLFGINVVIPILYTFGHQTSDDELTDAASELNETIPAERNYYITGWRGSGLNPTVAYESQALIQLGSVHCRLTPEDRALRRRNELVLSNCETCPVFKHICSRASILDQIPAFLNGMKKSPSIG